MKDFRIRSPTSKPPNFTVYRIILKTPCLSNQFYDFSPFDRYFSTPENFTPSTDIIKDRQVKMAVLTAAILSPKKLNKTGIKIIVFYFYFVLLLMLSKTVSFGLHDLCFSMLSTTLIWNSLMGGSWGNIFILKFVSDASRSLSNPSQSWSRHRLSASVVFSWRDDGGWRTFYFSSSDKERLSTISRITFFIYWDSFSKFIIFFKTGWRLSSLKTPLSSW